MARQGTFHGRRRFAGNVERQRAGGITSRFATRNPIKADRFRQAGMPTIRGVVDDRRRDIRCPCRRAFSSSGRRHRRPADNALGCDRS